jgi:DNA sulfur modification protein DndE
MEPPVDRVRISQSAKDQLIKLKRVTKIDQWNILCRWAFCRSLAEPTPPSPVAIPSDSNVEMSWQVFGGTVSDLLIIALKQRCRNDELNVNSESLATQFRLHLHRGIGYLSANSRLQGIEQLILSADIDNKTSKKKH